MLWFGSRVTHKITVTIVVDMLITGKGLCKSGLEVPFDVSYGMEKSTRE